MKIFVAGATGAVGLPLVRALCTLGHQVTGMTRAGRGADRLRELGAVVSAADAFDPKAVRDAIAAAAPDVVIDQMTWLPANPADIIKSMPNDTRLHREGGGNLLAAAQELGVRRYILQSRGFYLDAPAGQLADEAATLRHDAPGEIGASTRVTAAYEDQVLASPAILDGVVLRYGFFYGPGTWYRPDGAIAEQVRKRSRRSLATAMPSGPSSISTTPSRQRLPPDRRAGDLQLVDDDPLPVAEWLPAFARWVDAPNRRGSASKRRFKSAGEEAVYYHTKLTGVSNNRAKAKLGFAPRPLLWKGGAA